MDNNEAYFHFKLCSSQHPEYRYTGGTQCMSEVYNLPIEASLLYIDQHARLDFNDRIDSRKNEEQGRLKWKLGTDTGGVQGIRLLNQAIADLPSEQGSLIHQDIREIFHKEGWKEDMFSAELDPEVPTVSDKIQVHQSAQKGRYIVATEDIEVGETLLCEEPLVSYLHTSQRLSNCTNCLRPVVFGVGCCNCNQVIFCSARCKERADFHCVECGQSDLLPPFGPVAAVIRMFTKYGVPHLLKILRNTQNKNIQLSLKTLDGIKDIGNLQAGNKTDSVYRLEKAAWTVYVLSILKRLGLFQAAGPGLGEEELVVGRLVDQLLKIADNNCHEICELDCAEGERIDYSSIQGGERDEESRMVVVIGAAVYLRSSLFNNSCDVNSMKSNKGTTEVLRAKRKIRAGEEVSDFYGEYFFLSDKFSRKRALGFSCCCRACKENWGLLEELPAFAAEDLETRNQWLDHRIQLQRAADSFNVEETKHICEKLGELAGVSSPHEALIVPEMYLNFSNLLIHNNKSLRFSAALLAQSS